MTQALYAHMNNKKIKIKTTTTKKKLNASWCQQEPPCPPCADLGHCSDRSQDWTKWYLRAPHLGDGDLSQATEAM
jgi:hypothetical protein